MFKTERCRSVPLSEQAESHSMNQLAQSRSHCIIESAVQLALLFESESEWEAADKIRRLLYYFLGEDFAGALRVFDSLAHASSEFAPSGPRRQITQHLAGIGSILSRSMNGDKAEDSVLLARRPSSNNVHSAATAFL
jgi:hypothetical protein